MKIRIAPAIEMVGINGRTLHTNFAGLHIEYTIGEALSDEWIKQNAQALRMGLRTAIALSSKTWQVKDGMDRWLECEGTIKVENYDERNV